MSNRLTVYSAEEVNLIVGTFRINDGLPKGGFLKIATPEHFGHIEGLDGHVARFRKKSRVYVAEIMLMQTSSHHAELNGLLILDTEANNGAGIVPFFVKDNQGTALYASEHAWVQKGADSEFGEEAKELSPWIIIFLASPKTAFPAGA